VYVGLGTDGERGESGFGQLGRREGAMPSLEARYWADRGAVS